MFLGVLRSLSIDGEFKFIFDTSFHGVSEILSYDSLNSGLVRLLFLNSTNYPSKGVLHYKASTAEYYLSNVITKIGKKVDDETGKEILDRAKKDKYRLNRVHDFSKITSKIIDFKNIYFNSVVVEYTTKCNSSCRHCYISASIMEKKVMSKCGIPN